MQTLTLYKSSAGSGKTFTLVVEYLKLVLPKPHLYRHILAVTFTNKATEEMKSRIVKTLAELSQSDDPEFSPYHKLLRDHFDEQGETDLHIPTQARQVLNRILNDYSSFSVNTIESFFQSIVRAFARELNLALSFEVEMRTSNVLTQLVDEMFLDMGQDTQLTKLLEGYVRSNLADEKGWNIEREIQDLGRQIFSEQYQQLRTLARELSALPEEPMQATLDLAREIRSIIGQYEATAQKYAQQAFDALAKYGLDENDLSYKKGGAIGMAYKILNEGKYVPPGSRAEKGYDDPSAWYSKKSDRMDAIQAALDDGLLRAHQELVDHFRDEYGRYETARQVQKSIYSLGLLDRLQDLLEQFRRENARMLISDTGLLLRQVIGRDNEIPFVYEKVGTRFQHYLLDEFQDTSSLQWQNLKPLLGEAMSHGGGSLIVGDAKQSIYRWRNGNMKLLLEEVEEDFSGMTATQNLQTNYRTAKDIVEFNNDFFVKAQERLCQELAGDVDPVLFGEAYGAVGQTPDKQDLSGYIEIRALVDESKKKDQEGPRWQEKSLMYTLEVIKSLKEEGFRGSDITLLVRTNSDGIILAEFLQKAGVKVVSAESLLIASHPGVQFMLALLRYLNHENEDVTRGTLVQYFQVVVAEGTGTHTQFAKVGESDAGFRIDILEQEKAQLQQLSVYEVAEKLIRMFPQLAIPNAYIQGFMNLVLEYSASQDASIAGFLAWWDEKGNETAIASNPDPDAVQILTIHKSKGLEFPVVILPFCDWVLEPKPGSILWVQPEEEPFTAFPFLPLSVSNSLADTQFVTEYQQERLESYLDNLNLLYVAFTRPEYRLYAFTKEVSASKGKPKPIKNIHQLMGSMMVELDMEATDMEGETIFWRGNALSRSQLSEIEGKHETAVEQAQSLKLNSDPLGDWNQSIRIRFQSRKFLNTDQVSRQAKIDAGKLLHEALAYIENREDLTQAVGRMLSRGLVNSREATALEKQLIQVMSHEPAAPWFDGSWKVRNEAEIITGQGQVLIPDRVMVKGNQAVVVDYKTGQAFASHQQQVKVYQDALLNMGYQIVEGYVYYLSPPFSVVAVQ